MKETFKITEAHLKLAKKMCVSWEDCEFGAPSINCKRPYGNSDVISDIGKILGLPKQQGKDGEEDYPESLEDYMQELHKSMEIALQIFLLSGEFRVGIYEKQDEYSSLSWKLKE